MRPDRRASRDRTRAALQELLTAIQRLKARGASQSGAARALGPNRKTVLKYWRTTEATDRPYTHRGGSRLAPYESYLHERWRQGERNATQLWREARERGDRGAYQSVARYAAALKQLSRAEQTPPTGTPTGTPARAGLTVRHAVALALGRPDRLTATERATLCHAQALHPEGDRTLALLVDFAALVRRRPVARPREHLDAWEAAANALGAPEMTAFPTRLKQDRTAVEAALVLPSSQGQTEGHITRPKALKRQMFGRASFDLLRKRFLAAP